ncbi:MAG: hypothetical protein WA957_03580 [Alteraurantiacibacter sp.]
MKVHWQSFAIGLALSLTAIWLAALPAYFLVESFFVDFVASQAPDAPISMFIARGGNVFGLAIVLSILATLHWAALLPFIPYEFHKAVFANLMLLGAFIIAGITLFEHVGHDFFSFSLFCSPYDSVYFEMDISFQCVRSRQAINWAHSAILFLALIAIPVRLVESLRAAKAA